MVKVRIILCYNRGHIISMCGVTSDFDPHYLGSVVSASFLYYKVTIFPPFYFDKSESLSAVLNQGESLLYLLEPGEESIRE